MRLNQITLPAIDFEATQLFYKAIGLQLIVKTEHYLRFVNPKDKQTLSFHLVTENQNQSIIYFESNTLNDLKEEILKFENLGIQFETELTLEPWLWHEIQLKDPNGNQIILFYAGDNRLDPPWKINSSNL